MIAALPRRFPVRGTTPLSLMDGLVSPLVVGHYSVEEALTGMEANLDRLLG